MKTLKELIKALMILSMIFLTACGGGDGIETNFNIENGGFKDWDNELEFYADKAFETEIPYVNQTKVQLIASRGEIIIEGDLNADSIIVEAELLVESDSLADAEEQLANLEVMVTEQNGEILIQSVEPEKTNKRKYIIDYYIILPSDLEIEIAQDNGDITVENLDNFACIDSENGNIYLSDIFGNVDVDLSNGSIDGSVTMPIEGEIIMTVDNGKIDLSIPTSTSAELEAVTVNGSVNISNLEFVNLLETQKSVVGTLDQGDGIITLNATNGDISVVGVDE